MNTYAKLANGDEVYVKVSAPLSKWSWHTHYVKDARTGEVLDDSDLAEGEWHRLGDELAEWYAMGEEARKEARNERSDV